MDPTIIITTIITAMGAVATSLITQRAWSVKREAKEEHEREEMKSQINEISNRIDQLVNRINQLAVDIQNLKSDLDSFEKISNHNDEVLKRSIMREIKNTLHQAYLTFTTFGAIDINSLESIERLYESYVELGGNTFVKDEIEEIRKLPRVDSYINIKKNQNGGK